MRSRVYSRGGVSAVESFDGFGVLLPAEEDGAVAQLPPEAGRLFARGPGRGAGVDSRAPVPEGGDDGRSRAENVDHATDDIAARHARRAPDVLEAERNLGVAEGNIQPEGRGHVFSYIVLDRIMMASARLR